MSACGSGVQLLPPAVTTGAVVAGRVTCSAGVVKAVTDAGDEALCTVPRVSCDPALDVVLEGQCHYPPSPIPASACCDPRPSGCAPTDCDCMLREGPWLDYRLADAAGISFAEYNGPKAKCSYRLSCVAATDGGVPVISCTPA